MSSGDMQLLTIPPEELLQTAEQRERFNESTDLAEAAALVCTMRHNARQPDGKRGISQAELARRIGVSQARISHIENGEGRDGPGFTLLKRIARACDVEWAVNDVKPRSRPRDPAEYEEVLQLVRESANKLAGIGVQTPAGALVRRRIEREIRRTEREIHRALSSAEATKIK